MLEWLKLNKYRLILFVVVGLVFIIIFNVFLAEQLELKAFDIRASHRLKEASNDIVIVAIDQRTISYARDYTEMGLGRFPWPRTTYSRVIKNISAFEPKMIVVDIAFEGKNLHFKNPDFNDEKFAEELSGVSGNYFVHRLRMPGHEVYNFIRKNASAPLKEAVLKAEHKPTGIELDKIILAKAKEGIATDYKQSLPERIVKKFSYNVEDQTLNMFRVQNKLNYHKMPVYIEQIYQVAEGLGVNNVLKDPDDVLRRERPLYRYRGEYLFSIGLAAAHYAMGNDAQVILEKDTLTVGDKKIPLDNDLSFYLNWRKQVQLTADDIKNQIKEIPHNMHYKAIPFIILFFRPEQVPVGVLKDKIVLIGATADSLGDYYNVPVQNIFYGVELIATSIDTLLNDTDFLQKAPPWLNFFITIIMISLIVSIFVYFQPRAKNYFPAVFSAFVVIIGYIFVNDIIYVQFSYWLNVVNPVFVSIVTVILCVAVSLMIEKDKRSRVETTFAKYVSPQVYSSLLNQYEEINLSATRKHVTVLFSDIRGFTPFVEGLEPEEVKTYLDEYFTAMVEVILDHNGTIDKFMGDAIMAFWGAPLASEDQALQAVRAAKEMLAVLNTLNAKWTEQGRRLINIGIGINTGDVLVGNFGSHRLMDYTVMGDAVNLAARLESLNKEESTNILVSSYTYEEVKENVEVRAIGMRTVKGKSQGVEVYELLDVHNPA